jgi:hypothetical protein
VADRGYAIVTVRPASLFLVKELSRFHEHQRPQTRVRHRNVSRYQAPPAVQQGDRPRNAAALNHSLSHRAAARLEEVASSLAVVTWLELLTLLGGASRGGTELDVYGELRRRVSLA